MNSLIYLVGGVTTEVKAFIKSGPEDHYGDLGAYELHSIGGEG